MRKAVYNSAIPESIVKSANRGWRFTPVFDAACLVLLLVILGPALHAADWSVPEQQLAR
jgi:hypothetical protein